MASQPWRGLSACGVRSAGCRLLQRHHYPARKQPNWGSRPPRKARYSPAITRALAYGLICERAFTTVPETGATARARGGSSPVKPMQGLASMRPPDTSPADRLSSDFFIPSRETHDRTTRELHTILGPAQADFGHLYGVIPIPDTQFHL